LASLTTGTRRRYGPTPSVPKPRSGVPSPGAACVQQWAQAHPDVLAAHIRDRNAGVAEVH